MLQAKEERDAVLAEKLKFKSITDWNRKLENMHTILTAENSTCKLTEAMIIKFLVGKQIDEFERDF